MSSAIVKLWMPRIVLCSILLLGMIARYAHGDPNAEQSTAEGRFRNRLAAACKRCQNLSLRYIVPAMDQPGSPPGLYNYREITAKSPDFLIHLGTHGHDRLRWQDDPNQQRAVLTGSSVFNEYPMNRTYFTQQYDPSKGLPGTLKQEFYFIATGVWPLHGVRFPGSKEIVIELAEIANSKDYAFLERADTIGGATCHILERKHTDRLWFDSSRGCCLLARESFDQKSRARQQRFELSRHVEVARDLWLPQTIVNLQYDYKAADPTLRSREVIRGELDVIHISSEVIDPSVFVEAARPSPGSLVLHSKDLPVQSVAGGLDHLDRLVEWSQRFHTSQQSREVSPPVEVSKLMLRIACGAVLLELLISRPWSRTRRRAAQQPMETQQRNLDLGGAIKS